MQLRCSSTVSLVLAGFGDQVDGSTTRRLLGNQHYYGYHNYHDSSAAAAAAAASGGDSAAAAAAASSGTILELAYIDKFADQDDAQVAGQAELNSK